MRGSIRERRPGVWELIVQLPRDATTARARQLACERTHERWGVFGFSVLEVPNGDDYTLLARLRPEVARRRQLLVADGHELTADGFPVAPTLDHPHWTVLLAEATPQQFARVRRHFKGPIANPGWAP